MKTINVRVLEDAKEFDDLDEIIAEVKKERNTRSEITRRNGRILC